ncbi:MAG: rhodanese-related sulfurtransferase [Flavobacteriales bacterium]|nr:rhodanese-related sulfurtransferase [Flavobacteriales bacterium]
MDPNGGKKGMFNKLGRKEAILRLEQESFNRVTVSFYRYIIIENVESFRDKLYSEWKSLSAYGRIYLAKEGVNAQMSVPEHNWDKFVENLNSYDVLKDIPFKIAVEDDGKSFFKLTIKVRNQIVADGLSENDYDVTNVGKHLGAREWNEAIENGATVVDMRNHYESEIGKFKGAICPEVETFKEELPLVKEMLNGKEDEQVLLYCTGGIRCEKASAYLKNYGFNNVSQLHGGIIDYVRQIKEDNKIQNKFLGKNFVFDERRGERISSDVISNCHQCGETCDIHTNCRNVNCNLLFLQCQKCKDKHESCCSVECIEVANMSEDQRKKLRKGVENKKIYYSHKKVKLNLKE